MKKWFLLCCIGVSWNLLGIILPPGVEVPPEAIAQWNQRFGEDYNLDTGIQAREFLLSALKRQPELPFRAVLHKADPFNPDADVFFHYQPRPDGDAWKRAEVRKSGKAIEVYIQSSSAQYGTIEGKTGRIGEVLLLSACDWRYEPIPAMELSMAKFTREERTYQDRPCWLITVTICYLNDKEMILQTGFPIEAASDKKSILNTRYPIRRVFVIDRDTGFIYARRQYARNGKLVAAVELRQVDTGTSIDPELFAVSESLPEGFLTRDHFRQATRTIAYPSRPGFLTSAASRTGQVIASWNEWFWRNSNTFSMISGGVAVALLLLVAVHRYRERRR